ncbi:bile acid:sodium symporter family protein [Roseinatronobacter bogoriensis]|jgi:bile acid transporter|uniref:Transporter n=1 Tax=Roseinatronobacter bogoriensis subsp. barguzinensis TaxID=441209 RepID=A0A2K8K748_9RHOB|nr:MULTISPECIES: bile acid:sodium symporter family protein [Rhodobaca]ATX65281.1 transporter [Rhodobaca barguzinensis]MBB4209394.1 BASS family bile acid:Na+ symporter [Rhodobaca bogoriensis DSM 18756]TDW34545.1 BASS family bile acid:Na+ symporter [Rhodobaca barguzinensis]TDY67136.1 BASS family bile acid:Na+ symporter [Rhodobaca bogoriensis DSM 18756]
MLTELETTLLGVMMMVIMLGMGASMTPRDFLIAFRKPKGILVGLLSQFAVMPFLGFLLAVLLGLPPALVVGLLLIACMPGGTTSNIFAYFSKGVLALSIMMTTVSTLAAVVMVPLLLSFYGGLAGVSGDYAIPAGNVAQILVVLLVPTALGMVLRKLNPNVGATVELIGSFMGVAVIVFLIATWVPRNYMLLLETPVHVYAATISIGLIGMLFGYWVARGLGQDTSRSRTISLETGIQNGPLAVLVITLSFGAAMQQEVLLIPILYSLFIVLTSTVITLWYRRNATREALARDAAKLGTAP